MLNIRYFFPSNHYRSDCLIATSKKAQEYNSQYQLAVPSLNLQVLMFSSSYRVRHLDYDCVQGSVVQSVRWQAILLRRDWFQCVKGSRVRWSCEPNSISHFEMFHTCSQHSSDSIFGDLPSKYMYMFDIDALLTWDFVTYTLKRWHWDVTKCL